MKSLLIALVLKLKKRFRNKFSKLGTHLQVGLAALVFISLMITSQKAYQVRENTVKIEKLSKQIDTQMDSLRINDQVKDAQIDSFRQEVQRLKEINLRHDRAIAQAVRDLEELKINRAAAERKIDGLKPEELVEYFNTKSLKKK